MKKAGIFSLCILINLCFFSGCSDEETEASGNIVGTWEEFIPNTAEKPPLPNDLVITISIHDLDSSFIFQVEEKDDDTLYRHSGTWDLLTRGRGGDVLYLYGVEGYMLDTSANPDTLQPLHDTLANKTLIVDTTGSTGDLWIVHLKDLRPFMESLLDGQTLNMLKSIDLYMERQAVVNRREPF